MTRSLAVLIASLSLVLLVAGLVLTARYPHQPGVKIAATGVSHQGPSVAVSPVRGVQPPTPVRAPLAHGRRSVPHRTPSLDWDALAQCESSGHWDDNTGNGYYGGLQFLQRTWESFDTQHFAARADLATRWQQIVVAERVLRRQGLGAWPACSRKLGWVQ